MAAIHNNKSFSARKREDLCNATYKVFTAHPLAKLYKIYSGTVYHRHKRFQEDGESVIKEQRHGPELYIGGILNPQQIKRVQKTVIGSTPDPLKSEQ